VEPLFSDDYVIALYDGGARWREILTGYWRRLQVLMSVREYDAVILEKELFPFLPAFAERVLNAVGVGYVVDYDDALFHRYDQHSNPLVRWILGRKIDAVMRHSAVVVAGNDYLACRARNAGAPRIEVVPTVVDTERYQLRKHGSKEQLIVGWIGSPKTSKYLKPLLPIFEKLKKEMPVRFVAVGARAEDFSGTQVEAQPWSEESEIESIQQFDIGIMPLEDSPWERGKCGYKLIQYMGCGIPVVASPVGVNREIVIPEENGLFADNAEEWLLALRRMLQKDALTRQNMGKAGRKRVIDRYSIRAQAPRLLDLIREVAV
jgi:glycosyltransferase involved in cell wall biosynthesis